MNCYKCATPLPDHSKFCMACGADVSGEGHMHNTVGNDADPELFAALQAELGTDYTVERELGRGGMAIVYLGKDTHLGRKVAIKLLPPMLTFGSGPGFIERFKREARTSATLDHPHIIPVYRVSTGGKLFWYVMKFLQGESLDEMLKRDGPMEVDKVIDIVSQVADALDYAHSNDVVHRDVKPANMMMDKKGWVTVTDFGIAKALNTGTLTGSGSAIGTPHYMAPEQCVGVGVSGASDQYALGISAYQMFSGELPFKADSILELMRMHAIDPPPPLSEKRSGLHPGVIAAVERALSKEQKDRFPTCSDFAREMLHWTKDIEAAARRPTAAAFPAVAGTVPERPRFKPVVKERADTPPKPIDSAATKVAQPRKAAPPSRMRRVLIGAAVVSVMVVGGTLLYKTWQPKGAQTQAPGAKPDAKQGSASTERQQPVATPTAPNADSLAAERRADSARNADAKKAATVSKAPPPNTKGQSQRTKGQARDTKGAPPDTKTAAPAKPDATPAVVGTGTITVGSQTPAAILINGKPHPDNPVRNFPVPAGRVVITFQVADSTGVWTMDTVVTVAAGENLNLRRLALHRRP